MPIDVISAESLQSSGLGETNKILNQLIPSFNFPQPSINDGTDVIRPATLRGLNPDQTLILINGKRRHTSALLNINGSVGRGTAAVDINNIPTIALGRVEVLRDGAVALLHSPRAAALFATLADAAGLDRRTVAIVGISEAAARAAGGDWRSVSAALAPRDADMLAIARRLCQNPLR